MGYGGGTAEIIMEQAGFTYRRDDKMAFAAALVDGSKNVNFLEGGISKRGGTTKLTVGTIPGTPSGRGIYNFRLQNGNTFIVFATSAGIVYHTNYSNTIVSGLSTSNFFNFSTFNNEMYIADGANIPKYWTGSGSPTNVTPPTSWATTGYPFQMIPHARGASGRLWAITKDSVWASDLDDGHDFSDANVIQIPIYTESGLVGGVDFGGRLVVFSKTKAYIIDDSSTDTAEWGYNEAIWEGGVSHWRMIVKASNQLYLWTDEGLVYTISGVQATGDYVSASITRPAYIDRWIRDKVTRANVENFNAVYDRTIRCINYFVQVAGSTNNTKLKYFIDRPPEQAWIPDDNIPVNSGMRGAASTEVFVSAGVYKIHTQDYVGNIWKHEQTTNTDDGTGYESNVKFKPFDFNNLQMYKHFRSAAIRANAVSNFGLTIRVYVDGIRREDVDLDVSGTGAVFDTALLDTAVFASDELVSIPFPLGYYGYQIQFEIVNDTAGEDFFLSQMIVNFKEEGITTRE